jgi:hypothetical protein
MRTTMFDLERSILWTWKVSPTGSSLHLAQVQLSLHSHVVVLSLLLWATLYPQMKISH